MSDGKTCKGSIKLGTHCGVCIGCKEELDQLKWTGNNPAKYRVFQNAGSMGLAVTDKMTIKAAREFSDDQPGSWIEECRVIS